MTVQVNDNKFMKRILGLMIGVAIFAVAASVPVAAQTTYTSEAAFKSALSSISMPYYLNEFNDLNYYGGVPGPITYTGNAGPYVVQYNIASPPGVDAYAVNGAIGGLDNSDKGLLQVDFAKPVAGVGGYFYLTDDFANFFSGNLSIGFYSGPTLIATLAGQALSETDFFGVIGGGITSVQFTTRAPGGYPTLDHFYAAVPEPSVVWMNIAVLLGVAGTVVYRWRRARCQA